MKGPSPQRKFSNSKPANITCSSLAKHFEREHLQLCVCPSPPGTVLLWGCCLKRAHMEAFKKENNLKQIETKLNQIESGWASEQFSQLPMVPSSEGIRPKPRPTASVAQDPPTF